MTSLVVSPGSAQLAPSDDFDAMTAFMPRDMTQAMEFSKFIASGDMVPKDYRGKPANVFLAMSFAARLKMDIFQTMQNVSIINGRASIWGDLMWGIVTGHPQCEDAKEWYTGQEGADDYTAHCLVKRGTRSEPVTQAYSIADAKKAKLWNKQGPWQTDHKRMLKMRARGFCCRDAFADALKGLITVEEARDYPVRDQHGQPATLPKGPVVDALPSLLAGLPVQDVVDPATGEVVLPKDQILRRIDESKNEAGLLAVGVSLKGQIDALPEADRVELKELYKDRLKDHRQAVGRSQTERMLDARKQEVAADSEAPPWMKEDA